MPGKSSKSLKTSKPNSESVLSSQIDQPSSRQKLKDVAICLFAEKGLDGVTTRDIAKQSGLNIGLIAYYFKNKEGLYQTAVREYVESVVAEFSKLLDDFSSREITADNYRKLMNEALTSLVQLKLKSPHMHILLMRETLSGWPYLAEVYESVHAKIVTRFAELIARAQSKGIVRSDLRPFTLLFLMDHSLDSYLMAQSGVKNLSKCEMDLNESLEGLVEQFLLIFVEGVMK